MNFHNGWMGMFYELFIFYFYFLKSATFSIRLLYIKEHKLCLILFSPLIHIYSENFDALDCMKLLITLPIVRRVYAKSLKMARSKEILWRHFWSGVQCFDLQKSWAYSLPNIFKDTYPMFVLFFFLIIVVHETRVEDIFLKQIFFFLSKAIK